MVIERILKQLTPERVEKDIREVNKIKLPSGLSRWTKEFSKVGGGLRTTDYFWKWIYRTTETITLPFIRGHYRPSLCEIKTLLIMFVVLLDDIFDKGKNKKVGEELLKIPYQAQFIRSNNLTLEEKQYLNFTKKIWGYIQRKIKKYPKYQEFKDLFRYDVEQILNEMNYSVLINRNLFLINKTEFYLYFSHNMQAMTDITLDLMCFPDFDNHALGAMREIGLEAQKMARIGNWVSTWEREIPERDFTSGVFAEAIESNVFSVDFLKNGADSNIVQKIKAAKIEEKLLKEWEDSYHKIEKIGQRIKQVELIRDFLSRLEILIIFHLSSKGYK